MKTKETAKHTPAPWKISQIDHKKHRAYVWTDRPYPSGVCIAEVRPETILQDELEANARLIAAAPDLLEALLAVEEGFKDGSIKWAKPRKADSDPYHPANVKMCAAIDKAEAKP